MSITSDARLAKLRKEKGRGDGKNQARAVSADGRKAPLTRGKNVRYQSIIPRVVGAGKSPRAANKRVKKSHQNCKKVRRR